MIYLCAINLQAVTGMLTIKLELLETATMTSNRPGPSQVVAPTRHYKIVLLIC